MKRNWAIFLLLSIFIISCTKDVPENGRKSAKSTEEESIRKVVDNFFIAYNSGDIETAVDLLDPNYHGIVSDSIDVTGLDAAHDDLLRYYRQFPEGKWETKIEEITVGDTYSFVLCTSSFLMPNPVEKKATPIYSERSMRVLKKDKVTGWKIFRYLATPTFTYDE